MNLIINYYTDGNPVRNQELQLCLLANLFNKMLKKVIIIVANKDIENLKNLLKKANTNNWELVVHNERPTLNYYFSLTSEDAVNIIANSDIIIDENTIHQLENYNFSNKVLALSRWDFVDKTIDKNTAILFSRADSQDVWIKRGIFPQTQGADICLGKAGVDNKIAFLLEREHGYNVINPSLSIKTYHLHLSGIRNYTTPSGNVIDRIPPPYKTIQPSYL